MRNYFFTNFKRPFPIQIGSISFFVSPLRKITVASSPFTSVIVPCQKTLCSTCVPGK